MKRYMEMSCLLLVALLVSIAAGCGGGGGGSPAPAGADALVFMSMSSGSQQVWLMAPDGTHMTQVSSVAPGKGIQGDLSPNGRKVVYVSQVSGTGSQIVVQDLKTDTVTVLLTDPVSTGNDFAPAFSPNGAKIAYHDDRDGIHVMNADGTGDVLLPGTNSDDHTPSWNSAGTKIVFDRGWNGSIYIMNPDGTAQTQVLLQTEIFSYGQPQFLPDGRIVAMRYEGPNQDIIIVNADGTGETNLTPGTDSSNEFFPTVDDDGKRIAFATDRNGGKDIYVGTLTGTTVTNLVNVTAGVADDCWRPNFGYIDTSYVTVTP